MTIFVKAVAGTQPGFPLQRKFHTLYYQYFKDLFRAFNRHWHGSCYLVRRKEDTAMKNESGISVVEALIAVATLSMIVAIVIPYL